MHCLDSRDGLVESRVVGRAVANQALLGFCLGFGARTKYRATIALHMRLGNTGVVATGARGTDRREHQGGVCCRCRDTGVRVEGEDRAIVCSRSHEGRNDRTAAGYDFTPGQDRDCLLYTSDAADE